MPRLSTSLAQFALVGGSRRNHTGAVACRQPSRRPFGRARAQLYLLAEHPAANGHDHAFCHIVLRWVQGAYAAEEEASVPVALARALTRVNEQLWTENQSMRPHKRIPIGLVALALDGDDAYLCQIGAGQAFLLRHDEPAALPALGHSADLHAGEADPAPALGQQQCLDVIIHHCRVAPGDGLILCSTNLGRLVDAATLSTLAGQPVETVANTLSRLAEDYGLHHTSGLSLHVLQTPTPPALPEPLRLRPLAAEVLKPAPLADSAGLAPAAQSAETASPTPEAAPVAVATPPLATPDSVTDEPLPMNVVRLYSTQPTASPVAPDEAEDMVPAPIVARMAAPRPAPAGAPRAARRPATRARRERWLDALAATTVLAMEMVRRPAALRRETASQPDDAYAGDLTPVTAGGAAFHSLWRSTPGLNRVLLGLVAVTAALIAAAGMTSAMQSGLLPILRPSLSSAAPAGGSLVAATPVTASLAPSVAPPSIELPPAAAATAVAALAPAASAAATIIDDTPAAAPIAAGSVTVAPVAASASSVPDPGVRRLGPASVLADLSGGKTPASSPKRLVGGGGVIYVLDPYAGTLYQLDREGKAPTPMLARGWTIAREKVGDLLGATVRGTTLVVMDCQRVYSLDGPNNTWRVAPLAATGVGPGIHPVASFEGGLYVLDTASRQILKYAQGAYGRAPQAWLKAGDNSSLGGAIDLVIDGRIYALTGSGQIALYFRGALERTLKVETAPAVQSPAALVNPAGSPYLYLAETNGRVLQLTKEGTVVRQFLPAEGTDLTGLTDLWVDEAGQALYAVAGNRVVRLALPAAGRPAVAMS